MIRQLDQDTIDKIATVLAAAEYHWQDLAAYINSQNDLRTQPAPAPRSDVPSDWVKSAAEAILQSKTRITPNAQTFVAQTFARASQYDTVKFSPKQWEWFNKIMLSAGVEALTLEGNNQ